ncbi:type II toxin-antitoxin system VapC family toxin [Candidatus Woesearchaeota archaeon]|nr:type II toxin-antitoxin system VapC family toxin [Candidatus Woesearchaeota archaeon]
MKIALDSSVIIDIERRQQEAIETVKELIRENEEVIISTVTLSEILTGGYLKNNPKSVADSKRILSQFLWIDLNSKIAEKTAEYLAYLIKNGNPIEYQDVTIAATAAVTKADYLLTLNKKHFEALPDLKGKIFTPAEFAKITKAKKT